MSDILVSNKYQIGKNCFSYIGSVYRSNKNKSYFKKCKYKVKNKAIKRCITEGWYGSNCYHNPDYETIQLAFFIIFHFYQ